MPSAGNLATSSAVAPAGAEISTLVPARLERLPWGRFHVLVVAALGITWILDGLEVTLAGSVAGALKQARALQFSDAEVGAAGSAYLIGAVVGALGFGWLTDRLGRKKLFFTTIVVYLIATALTGLAWSPASFFLFRFLTGCGIGGEYSAINSTIQELIPARFRGHMDLMINGSFWVGAAAGAGVAVILLDPARIDPRTRLAAGVPGRRGDWNRRVPDADVDSGEPALARHPRARARSRGSGGGYREAFRGDGRDPAAGRRQAEAAPAHPHAHAVARGVRRAVSARATALGGRADADGGAGVLLQRDLLHLRAGADEVLRRRLRRHRLVYPAVRGRAISSGRCCSGGCSTRSGGG